MMKPLITFLLSILLLTACSTTPEKPKWKADRDAVMEVHDRTMASMGALHENQKQIKAKIGSLAPEDSLRIKGEAIIAKLANADNAMMDWMRQYEEPAPETKTEEAIDAYLAEQQKSIDKVDSMITNSLKEAKAFLFN